MKNRPYSFRVRVIVNQNRNFNYLSNCDRMFELLNKFIFILEIKQQNYFNLKNK